METTSRLRFNTIDDGLVAQVEVVRGPAMSVEQFEEALRAAGIESGIESDACTKLAAQLENPDFHCAVWVVARGRPCVPSKNAFLELAFAQGLAAGHVREDGTVDYHDRELLKAVDRGELVARVHPPERGVAGLRVDGSALVPVAPRELEERLLSGVSLNDNGEVLAKRSGVVLYVPGKSLDVVDHHLHDGSVDMHSGNLHMQGSLAIRGDVFHPFSVVATGDVDIKGCVDVATVISGGSLRVQRGVRGGEGAKMHAAGDITTHHAQSAELRCGGTLTVGEAVNSYLRASEVRVTGRLRGGIVEAERTIFVQEAGAPSGTATDLVAAKPLELAGDEAALLIAAEKAGSMSRRGGRGPSSAKDPSDKERRVPPSSPRSAGANELQHLVEFERRRDELQHLATIELGVGHPGVTLRIGAAHWTLTETVRRVRYALDRETMTLRAEKLAP